jgi:sec-independent protein translocase protein TatB
MFDIGFGEIALIAVVALIVVGPDEFPALVRNIGNWIGKIRRFMAETKSDLDREFTRAEELKQLIEREASMAALHEQIDARKIVSDTTTGRMVDTENPVKQSAAPESPAVSTVDSADVAATAAPVPTRVDSSNGSTS